MIYIRIKTDLIIILLICMVISGFSCASTRVLDIADQPPSKNDKMGKMYFENISIKINGIKYAAESGLIVLPENRNKSNSRLIRLPVIRIFSREKSDDPPIFYLTGGPGISNLKFEPKPALLKQTDVVLVGYRGVDGSSKLACPEIKQVIADSDNILSEEAIEQLKRAIESSFSNLKDKGLDLNGYTIVDVMYDLETVREALGYEKINLLSESYGTRIAQIYANQFPERVHRSVMIGANPPGRFIWEAPMIDKQIQQYSELYNTDRTDDTERRYLGKVIKEVSQNMPKSWMGFTIDPGKVKIMTFVMLFHRKTASLIFDAYLAAEGGDASGLALLTKAYNMSIPGMFVWGDFLLKAYSADFDPARNYNSELDPKDSIIGSPLSRYFWAAVPEKIDIPLIADQYRYPQDSEVETLIISGNLDFSTPAEYARDQLLPYLKNGRQLIFSDYGHVSDLWEIENTNIPQLIADYYQSGLVDLDGSFYKSIDFDITFGLPEIAKSILIIGSLLIIIPLAVIIF